MRLQLATVGAAAGLAAIPVFTPVATVSVGAGSGMLISAAGSVWTSDFTLGQVVRIDPKTNKVARRISLPGRPFALAYGAGSVWVADREANTMARIDPRTNRITKRITIGFQSYGAAFGAGSVWVTSEADGTVRRISPKTNRVTKTIKVGALPNGVVYAFGALWVANLGSGGLVRVDAKTNRVTKRIKLAKVDWITPSPDSLWVSSETGQVYRVNPRAGAIVAKVRVGANPLGSAWVSTQLGGELWVPNIDDGTVSIVEPAQNTVRTTLTAGKGPLAIVSAAGDAWISNSEEGTVWRVSPQQQ
jgi:YVTN family beta-propeller protein